MKTDRPRLENFAKTISLFLTFFLLLGFHLWMLSRRTEGAFSTDFYKFYSSARFYLEGKNIYTPIQYKSAFGLGQELANKSDKATPRNVHPNLNSPTHTLTILPFALLPFMPAFWAWSLFSLGAAFLSVYVIVKSLFGSESQFTIFWGISVLLMAYFPTLINIILGQFGFFVLAFAILLWYYARDRRSLPAGIVLGLAISIKVFFAFFFVFFAVRREWKVISTSLITLIAVNLLGLYIFGVQNYHQYFIQHSAMWLYINASWNASILAFFTRIFGGATNTPFIQAPQLGFVIASGLCFLLSASVIWISTPRKDDSRLGHRFDLGFSISLIAMLLISPYAWIYYFPCLILPLILYWRFTSYIRGKSVYRTIIAVIWALSSWPTSLISSESAKLNDPVIWFTSAAYYHYALLAFAVILIVLVMQENKKISPTPSHRKLYGLFAFPFF